MYCRGSCGDDWDLTPETKDAEKGCQNEDADAFCVLKLCNKAAFPKAGTIKFTKATNETGFACDSVTENGITNYPGPFFGIKDVKVDINVLENHGAAWQGVVRAECVIPGKYNSFLRVI